MASTSHTAPEVAALRQIASAGGGTYQGASSGELKALMLRELGRAHADNEVGMAKAMYAGHDCTLDAIKRQSTALIRRITDRQAGRINSATTLVASRASSDRSMAAMKRDVSGHQQGIENRMDALDK